MTNRPQKSFFKTPKVSEIKKGRTEREITGRFVEQIESLPIDQYGLIGIKIISSTARHFMHHGRLIDLDSIVEKDEILRTFEEVFARAFHSLGSRQTYGYRNKVTFGGKPRIFPWVNCLEGAKIFAYTHSKIFGLLPMEVKTFDGTFRDEEIIEHERINVSTEGGTCIVKVPSRRKGVGRYSITIYHVPIKDNQHKFEVAMSTYGSVASSDQIHDLRFEGEYAPRPSERHLVSGLEAAAMFAIAEGYLNKGNPIPAQLCPVLIPSERLVNFYNILIRQCLIKIPEEKKTRRLTKTEMSRLIGTFIWINGYKEAMWNKKNKKLRDYDWKS